MPRSRSGLPSSLLFALLTVAIVCSTTAKAASDPAATAMPGDLAPRVMAITDAVLEHHIDPPSRQQMILAGIKAAHEAAGVPAPAGLARRVSALAAPAEITSLLSETWPQRSGNVAAAADAVSLALIEGVLGTVPGGASLLSGKERKVAEQIEGNLYVGIQIALGYDNTERTPQIQQLFEGGPAQKAGVKQGDRIMEIDGVSTRDRPLAESVDRLRGEEGTTVTIKVLRPGTKDSLSFTLTRARLPRKTITGLRTRGTGEWDFRFEGTEPIGYLRIEEITGSTPHELRTLASRLESQGVQGLILDLRTNGRFAVHPTILVADALLDGGRIGRIQAAEHVQTYEAEPDALFQGWPLVVLVDPRTNGAAEWLAAALQDNHRATIVGAATRGLADVETTVPVGDGTWSIQMVTGRFERADGRPLGDPKFHTRPQAGLNVQADARSPKDQWGISPDHIVGSAGPPGRSQRPERPRQTALPKENPAKDPVIIKAYELLREGLKSI